MPVPPVDPSLSVPGGRYLPGDWVLLCGAQTWILADVVSEPDTRDVLWSLLATSSGLSSVLDALAAAGVERVPSFALIHLERGAEKAVLRGRGTITLAEGGADAVDLSCPPGVTTWLEHPADRAPVYVR